MVPDEVRAVLLETARTATLATVRADGRPHAAPIWFDLDGEDIVFNTGHDSIKAANLRREPRVVLCVDDDTPPFAFVLIEGVASIDEAAPDLADWAGRIGARYMGADRADEFARRNLVPGEWLVRVRPTKIVARRGVVS